MVSSCETVGAMMSRTRGNASAAGHIQAAVGSTVVIVCAERPRERSPYHYIHGQDSLSVALLLLVPFLSQPPSSWTTNKLPRTSDAPPMYEGHCMQAAVLAR